MHDGLRQVNGTKGRVAFMLSQEMGRLQQDHQARHNHHKRPHNLEIGMLSPLEWTSWLKLVNKFVSD
jgi:hypothetical protein